MSHPVDTRYSFDLLDEALNRHIPKQVRTRGNASLGGIKSVLPRYLLKAYYRCRTSGFVPEVKADEFAVYLGMHPSEIWPNWFEEVAA